MLSVALLVALVLSSGTAVSAHAALSVSLSGAASFTGVDNAVVSARVTNTGDETLKVLNAPGSVLSKGPTDVFSISSGGGKAPHFRGLFAKYNPSHAKSYTTLAPGQSVVVEHSLAAAYDFTASGAGTYRITSSPEFFIVANGGVKRLSADVSAHTARLSGNLKSKLALENLQVAITAPTCNSTARSELQAAAQGADTLVAQAVAYLNAHSAGTATSRYTTWFGAATIARYTHVQLAFDSLSATSFATDVTYECVTGAVCNPDFVDSDAFTRTDTPGHIWICPAYFEPNDEGETPSGLLVHLGTHWDTVAHTGHWAFGIEASEELASALPDFAIDNADSYEYFAQNTPALP